MHVVEAYLCACVCVVWCVVWCVYGVCKHGCAWRAIRGRAPLACGGDEWGCMRAVAELLQTESRNKHNQAITIRIQAASVALSPLTMKLLKYMLNADQMTGGLRVCGRVCIMFSQVLRGIRRQLRNWRLLRPAPASAGASHPCSCPRSHPGVTHSSPGSWCPHSASQSTPASAAARQSGTAVRSQRR